MSAKDVIYDNAKLQEEPEVQKLYQKTHGLTQPGEQLKRDYNWHFNPNNHVFGKPDTFEQSGCAKSLKSDKIDADFPKTKIGNKRLEDYRQATATLVGTQAYHGSLRNDIDPEFTYGKKAIREDVWNSAKCIIGNPESVKEVEPDRDLGRSVAYSTKISRKQPVSDTGDRIFGVPSIRYDLKKPFRQSMTDTNVEK